MTTVGLPDSAVRYFQLGGPLRIHAAGVTSSSGVDPINDKLVRALLMEPADDGREVAVSTPYAYRHRLSLERRHQWGGEVLFYVCAGCQRPRRHLYPWPVIDDRLVQDLNPRCVQCAGLRYLTQGIPGGGPSTEPWHPRAVSDARMVASEFPGSLVISPG